PRPAQGTPLALDLEARRDGGPLAPRRLEGRQRLEPRDPLVQPVKLCPALVTAIEVTLGIGVARFPPWLTQGDQLFNGQVRHAGTSSPSQRRRRVCARASWDFEKLTVLPIMPAISSWV